jgi:hypothetical protein
VNAVILITDVEACMGRIKEEKGMRENTRSEGENSIAAPASSHSNLADRRQISA